MVFKDFHDFKNENMQLTIHGERLISEVQRDFTNTYPYLKIEFFRNGSIQQHQCTAQQKLAQHFKLKDSWNYKKDKGTLHVRDSMTVQELENAFMDEFGLTAQVFRKSGNIWLETTITDNWTLKQQSDHGKEISSPSKTLYQTRNNDYGLNRDAD
jgi:glycerol-3-phosphate O-acyltransferase